MIQKDCDAINCILPILYKLKDYTNQLGQIEVLKERLCLMDPWIGELQMRLLIHVLENWLVRLEDRLQDQHKEITILQDQICCCGQQGDFLVNSLICLVFIEILVPPVSLPITSSEEEEELELDYTDDPPLPYVEGTAQGRSVSLLQLSKS